MRKKYRDQFDRLERLLERVLIQLTEETAKDRIIDRLEEQNKALFQKLMARNLTEFSLAQPSPFTNAESEYDPLSDVGSAGTIMEIEDGKD